MPRKKERIKLEIEFPIKCSPALLYNYISSASGLSEWFAHDVDNKSRNEFTFKYEDGELYAVCTYDSPVTLNNKELKVLLEYTQGQWSDGIGEVFEQQPVYVDDYEVYISMWHKDQVITIKQEKV